MPTVISLAPLAPSPPMATPIVPPGSGPGCAVMPPTAEDVRFHRVRRIGQIADRTWLVTTTYSEGPASLTHLGPNGRLWQTSLPEIPERFAMIPPSKILMSSGDAARWFTVDLAEPDAPGVSAVTELADEGIPQTLIAGTKMALMTLLRETGPQGIEHVTALYELPSGKRLTEQSTLFASLGHCRDGRCFALAMRDVFHPAPMIVRIDEAGMQQVRSLGDSLCPCPHSSNLTGCTAWRNGNTWSLALSDENDLRLLRVDLVSGTLKETRISPAMGRCPRSTVARIDGRSGVVVWGNERRAFYAVNATGHVDGPIALPPPVHLRAETAPLDGGAVLLDYDSFHGRDGASSAGGRHVHWPIWSFSGQASFVLATPGGSFALRDTVKLPHGSTQHRRGGGFDVYGLTRPAGAIVLMHRKDTFGPSHAVTLRQPCP